MHRLLTALFATLVLFACPSNRNVEEDDDDDNWADYLGLNDEQAGDCEDGIDNDEDGLTDCQDDGCDVWPNCSPHVLCVTLREDAFGAVCRLDSCDDPGAWQSGGPFIGYDSCLAARSGDWPVLAGGGMIPFENSEISGSMSLEPQSPDSPEIDPGFTGLWAMVLPDGLGVVAHWAPPDSFGYILQPGDGWISFAIRADETAETLEVLSDPVGYTYPDVLTLKPGTARVLYNQSGLDVSGTVGLLDLDVGNNGSEVSLDLRLELGGLNLSDGASSYDASGIIGGSGEGPVEAPLPEEVPPGDDDDDDAADDDDVSTYPFTCEATGQTNTIDIAMDGCEDEQEVFAEVFSCNLIDDFCSACNGYYGCYGADTETACAGYCF